MTERRDAPAPETTLRVKQAADEYVAEQGIEHSGGIIERAFEAGALSSIEHAKTPYGYVFGGCTFLRNGSPLLTEYVIAKSMAVFLHPAENVMETYKEVMTEKLLPCPFCGSSAHIERVGDRRQSTIYQCDNCSCSLETGEEWGHGTMWNERAPTIPTKPIGFMDVDGLGTLVDEVRARPAESPSPETRAVSSQPTTPTTLTNL